MVEITQNTPTVLLYFGECHTSPTVLTLRRVRRFCNIVIIFANLSLESVFARNWRPRLLAEVLIILSFAKWQRSVAWLCWLPDRDWRTRQPRKRETRGANQWQIQFDVDPKPQKDGKFVWAEEYVTSLVCFFFVSSLSSDPLQNRSQLNKRTLKTRNVYLKVFWETIQNITKKQIDDFKTCIRKSAKLFAKQKHKKKNINLASSKDNLIYN